MTKENVIFEELRIRANLVEKYLSQLERRTILWITKPQGFSIFITLYSMERARAGDVLRKLDLPIGRNQSKSVRQKFDDLVRSGFLNCEQDRNVVDKYYAVTIRGRTLAAACVVLINSLEKQSMEIIRREGENLALFDLVRDFTRPGEEPRGSKVGEIPEFHHPRLNKVKDNNESNRRIAGNGYSQSGFKILGFNPLLPATRTEKMKRIGDRER